MKKIFLAASGVFASIPGLAIIVSGLGTPPGYSRLFGGIIETFGALAILLLASGKTRIRRLSNRQAAKTVLILAVASFCLLILYLQLTAFCVVSRPVHGTVFYPLWTSGHLAQMVDRAGGRYPAVDHFGAYPLTKAVEDAPGYPFSMVVTTALLLFVYQGVFTSIAGAFGILGLRGDKITLKSLEPLSDTSDKPIRRKRSKKVAAAGENLSKQPEM